MNEFIKEKLAALTPAQREQLRLRSQRRQQQTQPETVGNMDFSLFFFSASDEENRDNKYEQLFRCAEFGDRQGFKAIWIPERHFTPFGGLYPNPSVLAAALAVRTEKLELRAGSVVVPLHNPLRIVEEWSVVDNLSGGRVALALASGWHRSDFAMRPEAWPDRRQRVADGMEQMQRLWRGEAVSVPGVDGESIEVRTWPRPIQPELRYWLTCSSPEGWIKAGELGCHVLCMMGNSLSLLEENIDNYRQARQRSGHDAQSGIVTVMIHTYLDNDIARAKERVREPMLHYLEGYIRQYDTLVDADTRQSVHANKQQFLEFAFERYFEQAALFGPVDKCRRLIHSLNAMGVGEIACLIDFGLPTDVTLASLTLLSELIPATPASQR
ncbi:MupA/Atu3671 family FMN-dependent luciferase-like monooxygenase [Erwinia piriflorinigrans]|uniref:Luciferase-like monooxygenase n=1 Tax=Erwinia piriflorinigrans CFBP 5888 TaxID=1161919 RepID=V5ZCQ1_9GAMM|nr:MupA/Atu3671 family FMN-dependent luciferase-like monooxygenase [Erwinia piriflorinigrans]CCG89153.1 luciferase-like monooxygenase [Erwinia piriflorinigrans CFBP 5888]